MVDYIISPNEMYAAEQAVIAAGRSSFSLMDQAGTAVADLLQQHYPDGTIRVLCGPGGNGGDGFVAATRLAALGRQVSVFLLGSPDTLRGDPKTAAVRWTGPIEDLSAALEYPADVTLDALFGGGLSRPLEGVCARLAETARAPIISVDVPSGLDGLSGRPLGPCFHASLTITFAALRPAHVLSPGKSHCGRVEVVDIGVPVPTRIAYKKIDPAHLETARVFTTTAACARELRPRTRAVANELELALIAADHFNQPVLIEQPDRLIAMPSGELVVDAGALA